MNQDPTQSPTHLGSLPPEPLTVLQLEVLFLNPECAQGSQDPYHGTAHFAPYSPLTFMHVS